MHAEGTQRPSIFRRSAALLAVALILAPDLAPLAGASGLRSVKAIEVAPGEVRIKTDAPVKYKSFFAQNPPRLVVDLYDTQYQVDGGPLAGDGGLVQKVRGSQYRSRPEKVSRVVLELAAMAGYQVVNLPTGLKIMLGEGASAAAQAALQPKPGKPVELFRDAPAPQDAAAQPPAGADESAQGSGQASAEPEGAWEPAEASPSQAPAKRRKAARAPHRDIMSSLPHDKVDLDYDAADVRDVIKLMGSRAGINIIYGNDVAGSLTIHLQQVPFDEAFRTVLAMQGLTTQQAGQNILRIMTPSSLKTERTVSVPSTRIFNLAYTKADEIKSQIDSVRTAEGRVGSSSVAKATNALIVTDTPDGLLEAETLIAQLDKRPKQVLIEAKLIEVQLNKSFSLGIQWEYENFGGLDSGGHGNFVGQSSLNSSQFQNLPLKPATGAEGRGVGVLAPAQNVVGALTVGRITNTSFLTATLTAAATNGKLRVLSDPKVATLNNQEATINITTQIPYATTNVSPTAGTVTQTVSNVTTGIVLTVTPTVNADGRVTLKIQPQVSQPGTAAGGLPPPVSTRNATTTVMAKDGETVVIGGLITDNDTVSVSKVPLLGDIPLLGALFRSTTTSRTRQELMVFVKPTIMPD